MSSIKVGTSWRTINGVNAKVGSSWKSVKQAYVKVGSTWRKAYEAYTYSWSIGSYGSCSASCGGGTQTRSVVCKRSDGATVADSHCSGSKPGTTRSCNTQSCKTCKYEYGKYYWDLYWPEERSAIKWNNVLIADFAGVERVSYSKGGYLYTIGTHKYTAGSWPMDLYYSLCREPI